LSCASGFAGAIPLAYRRFALSIKAPPCVTTSPSDLLGTTRRIVVINATSLSSAKLNRKLELAIAQQMARISRRMIQEGYAIRFARCGARLQLLRMPYAEGILRGAPDEMSQAVRQWLDANIPPAVRSANNFLVYSNAVDYKQFQKIAGFAEVPVAVVNPESAVGLTGVVFVSPALRNLTRFFGFPVDGTAIHELLHALGAVDPRAPHATQRFHCFDKEDVMCYNDGAANWRKLVACPKNKKSARSTLMLPIDCRHDDYFDPRNRIGAAGIWNVANSPFLMQLPPPTKNTK